MTAHGLLGRSHRHDIDGLRGIAVLSVVFFHLDHSFLPGGFVGVDVFFVISGYLITQQMVRDVDANEFSLKEFYRRRIRRIAPAMLVLIAPQSWQQLRLSTSHTTLNAPRSLRCFRSYRWPTCTSESLVGPPTLHLRLRNNRCCIFSHWV